VAVSEQVAIIQLVIVPRYSIANVTDTTSGFVSRNLDGSFYQSDAFCVNWTASFKFSDVRKDIVVNVTGYLPAYLREISANSTGRAGMVCYTVKTDAPYHNAVLAMNFNAFNWKDVSIAHVSRPVPFAVVRYDPQFTTYSYMEFRNSTAPSSLRRPWVLFVMYDGNEPGYFYAGNSNTRPFNGSETLAERTYFDNFTLASLSYQPFDSSGVFLFHVTNSTGQMRYGWNNQGRSAVLEGDRRIEKYVFEANPSSLAPLLSQGFIYQNVTMHGCWTHEGGCYLRQSYWLVPYIWSGRVNVVSVDSNGDTIPSTPLSITIHNPSPIDEWLTSNFEHVFGDDPQALRAFEEDLYPTNQTMTFTGEGTLSILLNQTSLGPPQISITAGGVTLGGNFTFVPTFVNSTIMSVPNAFNGTVFYSNATIPLWSFNMIQGSLSFLPVSTAIDQPRAFLELVNNGSSGWITGSTTEPQTPSAFASQEYGFWPMGENLTVYANLQGGGVDLLGVQRVGPSEYQATFSIEPWSGGIASVRLVEDGRVVENLSALNPSAYPSPLPQGLTGLYSISYPATGKDVKAVFTNVWGAKTVIDLGTSTGPAPLVSFVPETTAAAFGIAGIFWLVVSGLLKMRRMCVLENDEIRHLKPNSKSPVQRFVPSTHRVA
jgi:hypothetical protein